MEKILKEREAKTSVAKKGGSLIMPTNGRDIGALEAQSIDGGTSTDRILKTAEKMRALAASITIKHLPQQQ